MRVGLSLLTLVPGISGGSETYARGLAGALAERRELDVVALVPTIAPDAGEGLPTRIVDEYRAGRSTGRRLLSMSQAWLRPGRLKRQYADLDVVHFPLTVPIPQTDARTLVTLHDVQHLDLPENFSRAERALRQHAYDRAAQRADAVIVISEFVRERAIELLGVDPDRVRVIHLGIDHALFRPGQEPRGRFLLYPARPWRHKNHERMFQAFAELRRRDPDLELLVPSYQGPAPDGARSLGHLPREELARLYRTAAALVFPSLYEGFGLPPLEAMACGCPVAASDLPAIREVCGEAAELFDPTEPDAITAGVLRALDRAAELRERGLARAATFTWDACAGAHEDVYRSLG